MSESRARKRGALRKVGLGLHELPGALWLMGIRHLPGSPGVWLRRRYWGRRLGALGAGARIDEGVHFVNPERIFVGSRCWIAPNVFIGAGPPSVGERELVRRENPIYEGREGDVVLGDDVYLAPATLINGHGGVAIADNVSVGAAAKLYSSSHHYRGSSSAAGVPSASPGLRKRGFEGVGVQALLVGPIVICRDSFVGSHAVVLPGVTVGPATWLGAGTVTHRSPEPGRVYRAPAPLEAEH